MKVFSIILGVLLVIGGIFCLFQPGATFLTLGVVAGVLLVVAAVGAIIDFFVTDKKMRSTFDLIWGIITGLLGILILANRGAEFIADMILVYIFSTWILIGGIIRIAVSLKLKKLGSTKWGFGLAIGILFIVLAIISFLNPLITALTIGLLVGGYIIATGVNLFALAVSIPSNK